MGNGALPASVCHTDTLMIDVSIIIVSWNTRALLLSCIEALAAAVGRLSADIWVVDNASIDGSVEAVQARFPAVKLISNEQNVGFAGANNQAIRASNGRYALLLNSDTVADSGAIERLVHFADATPQAGVIGAMLLNPDRTFQASFADFPSFRSELLSATGVGARLFFRNYPSYGPRQSQHTRRVGYIPGACMLVRREAITAVGIMDESYFMYSEETDWCLRMQRAGWETWYLPTAKIVHFGGQSTRQVRFSMQQALYRSKVRFFRKHYGTLWGMLLSIILFAVLRVRWGLQAIFVPHQRIQGEQAIRWGDLWALTPRDAAVSQAEQ